MKKIVKKPGGIPEMPNTHPKEYLKKCKIRGNTQR